MSSSASLRHPRRSASSTPSISSPKHPASAKHLTPVFPLIRILLLTLLLFSIPSFLSLLLPFYLRPSSSFSPASHLPHLSATPHWPNTRSLHRSLDYLFHQLSTIPPSPYLNISVSHFRSAQSSFPLFITSLSLPVSYANLSCIIVRVSPPPPRAHLPGLLVAAHVDSAWGSPGASDNAASVAVLVEYIKELMTDNETRLKRPVVFLFNAGEEALLPAAHAFVTQHPDAKNLVAHVNLESMGAGNIAHLFRLGPNAPWLATAYANAVQWPSASVCATDLFDLGLIPAETDFTAFWQWGHFPGLDFAVIQNGWVYHTRYDDNHHVGHQGMLYMYQLVRDLVSEMAGERDAIGTFLDKKERGVEEKGKVVFFDLMMMVVVVYGEKLAKSINVAVLVVVAAVWVGKLHGMTRREQWHALTMVAVVLLVMVGALMSASFASFVYAEVYNAPLRWFGSWLKACFLYGTVGMFGVVSMLMLVLPRTLTKKRFDLTLFGVVVVYWFIVMFLTWKNVMCAYVGVAFLAMSAIVALEDGLCGILSRHFQLMSVMIILGSRILMTALEAVLPLLGRVRSDYVPHDTIAALLVTLLLLLLFILPCLPMLVYAANDLRRLRLGLFFMAVMVSGGLMLKAEVENYYQDGKSVYSKDAPKRHIGMHFYTPEFGEHGVVVLAALDPIEMKMERMLENVKEKVKMMENKRNEPRYWGGELNGTEMESVRPMNQFVNAHWYFETLSKPDLSLPTASVVSEVEEELGWNITLNVKATDAHCITLRMAGGKDTNVLKWSFNFDNSPKDDGAWIRHVGSEELTFSVLLKNLPGTRERTKLRLLVTNLRLGFSKSPILNRLNIMEWEDVSAASSVGVGFVL